MGGFNAVFFEHEGHHAAETTHLFFGDVVVGVIFKAAPEHLSNFGVIA